MTRENLKDTLLRATAIWVVIIFAESMHGIARRIFLEPMIGDLRARQIGVFIGSLIILAISLFFTRWLNVRSVSGLLAAGAWWVILTILFEMTLGVLVLNLSWAQVASGFDLSKGELLPLGLVLMLLTPFIAAKVRGLYPPC